MEDQTEEQDSSSNGQSAASSEQSDGENTQQNTLSPFGSLIPDEKLFDCLSFVMVCKKHNKVAVKTDKIGSWLPFVALDPSDKWLDRAITGAAQILNHGDLTAYSDMERIPFGHPELIHLMHLQLPKAQKVIVKRTTFYVVIRNDTEEDWRCCNDDMEINWVLIDDVIARKVEHIWGPEVYTMLEHSNKAARFTVISELFVEDATKYVTGEERTSKEGDLLRAATYGEEETMKIYADYIQHCWPSEFMCCHSFVKYMSKFGWNPSDGKLKSIFRAFDYSRNGHIGLYELLFGLAAMDQKTKHGGNAGALRLTYIFRYYDDNIDGSLDFSDVVRMIKDINAAKNKDENSEREAEARMKAMGKETADKITFPEFLKTVANNKFAGTSLLFRSQYNVMKTLSKLEQ
ncbi:Calcineurin-like protein phosphoesterase [Leptotrombidium deliense]|uniref:Calcineurin-like protein phosphoesterase n=1 Tax=Leptotrombidium deliense TaxID=299467 RepID=A0A443SI86_9ACAR|nr:Calcineurin-like protein phosphoesterase [Leptotrombidium deliense]